MAFTKGEKPTFKKGVNPFADTGGDDKLAALGDKAKASGDSKLAAKVKAAKALKAKAKK